MHGHVNVKKKKMQIVHWIKDFNCFLDQCLLSSLSYIHR